MFFVLFCFVLFFQSFTLLTLLLVGFLDYVNWWATSICRMDATLKELTSLVKEVNPEARRKGTFFDFAQVYPEVGGRMGGVGFRMREIGSTCSGQKGADDAKTLASVR